MTAAAARFSANNTDPKAVIIPAYQYGRGSAFAYIVLFYDGPAPPPGVFDDWLAIPSLSSNLATRDFASLIQSLEMITPIDPGVNAYFGSVNLLEYPTELLEYMQALDFVRVLSLASNYVHQTPLGTGRRAYGAGPKLLPVYLRGASLRRLLH